MHIRQPVETDRENWLRMRKTLWKKYDPEFLDHEIDRYFVGEFEQPVATFVVDDEGEMKGFVEVSIRPFAEGCFSERVAYIEGWFIDESLRGQGVGKLLIEAAEDWGREEGCTEIASDTDPDNVVSQKAHVALGFDNVGSIICFRKDL